MQATDRLALFWQPLMLSILRLVTGALYMQHGLSKLFGFPVAGPHMTPLFWVAGILETFGGFLVAVGLLTRPVALLLSGEMAIAYFTVHLPHSPYPLVNHGGPAVLFCFLFFYFFVAGPGVLSLDTVLGRVGWRRQVTA